MGGFEWATKVSVSKLGGIVRAKTEFKELAENPGTNDYLRYLAEELAGMWIVKPEERDEICWYEVKETLSGKLEIPKETYGENFGKSFPSEGETLLYCWEIPWLWKFPPEIMAIVASIFEKYGVLDVWWNIVRDGTHANDCTDNFWAKHGGQIFGEGISSPFLFGS